MKNRILPIFSICLALIYGCNTIDHDHDHDHDHDYATTVQLILTNTANPASGQVIATWKDPDGPGGNPPTQIDTLILQAGATYTGQIKLMNESKNPIVDITNEINNDAAAHQFFYTINPVGLATITIIDKDKNQMPVGLLFTAGTSTNTGNGMMNIVLSHFDQTPKNGKDKSPESDIDITFPLIIR